MATDSGISGKLPNPPGLVLVSLLVAVAINLLYPGEVFFQSRYLLILVSSLACAIVVYHEYRRGISNVTLRHLAFAFLPIASALPSLVWTTNQDRSQEVFLLFFSYACLLFCLWRCSSRAALLPSLSALIVIALAVEGHALYQHFRGLEALKAELMRHTTMDADFRSALLARVQSGRIFANFSIPNTLAGLITMILPIQAGLLGASFAPSRLMAVSPGWVRILTSLWVRLALMFMSMLSLWVLALTQSFGGWVGLCCSLATVLFVWLSPRRRGIDWIVVAGLLLMLAGGCLAWTSHKRGFRLWNLEAAENPITLRLISYRTAVDIFRDFPATGVGLGNYGILNPRYQSSPRLVTQFAHNTPLQLLSEGGLVLLAGLLCAAALAMRLKRTTPIQSQARCRDPLCLGMIGSLTAWSVHNGLDIDLYFPSLGALGFVVFGFLSNYRGPSAEGHRAHSSRLAGVAVVLVELAVGLAFLTGLRFSVSRSLLDLARVSASTNSFREANRYAGWAVWIRPKDAAGIILQGKLETQRLKQEGKPTTELLQTLSQSLEEGTRLDPYNAEIHFDLSRVYEAIGNQQLSLKSRSKAIALFPSESRYRSAKSIVADAEQTK
jgi:O-antigen ligase